MLLTLFGGFPVLFVWVVFFFIGVGLVMLICDLKLPISFFCRLPQLLVVFLYLCYSLLLWKCWYLYFSLLNYTLLNHIEF